jgi:hypothetical protein
MHRTYITGIILALATGCAATQPARELSPRAPQAVSPPPSVESAALSRAPRSSSRDRRECPADDPAARVIAERVERGGALVFTSPDNAADLRRRVVDLPLPSAAKRAELSSDNIRNGIRLVFKATEPGNVLHLQSTLDRYAERIADRCGLTLAPPKEPKKTPARKAEATKPARPKVETGSTVIVTAPNKTTTPAKPSPPKATPKPVAKSKPSEQASQPKAPPKLPTSLTNTPARARPGLPRQRGPNPNRSRTRRFAIDGSVLISTR